MLVKMRNLTLFSAALAALLLLAVSLSTCDSPLGFGDSIDFEPPSLTMDSLSNPYYVGRGATLRGDVTDNIIVDRVILRDADTGKEFFTAKLTGDNPAVRKWEIDLAFTEADNGKKLSVQVVAYDRAGNSGDRSIVDATLIIDISPPIVQEKWIQRTDVRRTDLEEYSTLTALERDDPRGELVDNADKYQNGVFQIKGVIREDETRIKDISLSIYDMRESGTRLLKLEIDGGNPYAPVWTIDEEELLAAGEKQWSGYTNAYYNNTRYYYRAVIAAYDSSNNENEARDHIGHFVMWAKADEPKGFVDPLVVGAGSSIEVNLGATLPVEFFDDDEMDWGYTGLLTEEQWGINGAAGTNNIAPGTIIPAGTDVQKLEWLKARFMNNQSVYNWRFGRGGTAIPDNQITNLFASATSNKNNTLTNVFTGNDDADNGKFMLFVLVKDNKLDPHPASPPATAPVTYRPRESLRVWAVNVKDVNKPLIVLDTVDTHSDDYRKVGSNGKTPQEIHPGGTVLELITTAQTGDSPEENTFPILDSGRYFTLNGYLLRANKKGVGSDMPTATTNRITKFRMAWIPDVLGDDYVETVQAALQANTIPATLDSRVQWWDLTSDLINGTNQYVGPLNGGVYADSLPAGTEVYTKQVFRKKFDILGGQDDKKSAYYNFRLGGATSALENAPKLFIFYAEDRTGNFEFRQLRLLGNTTPPEITVYDLTSRNIPIVSGAPSGLPNLNNTVSTDGANYYFYNATTGLIDDTGRGRYEARRLWYQAPTTATPAGGGGFTLLNTYVTNNPLSPGDIAAPNTAYPMDTIIKFWATARSAGALAVSKVEVRDITFAGGGTSNVGYYNGDANDAKLSYVERLSEVTQRVFQFVATDSLGNERVIQRTVAVTNAAILNNITTTTQTGSYGIGTTITLQANFTNLVRWTGTNPPQLNVRYSYQGTQRVRQINTTTPRDTASLYLEFPISVVENDTSILETLYDGIPTASPGNNGNTAAPTGTQNRPITLPSGTQILDAGRGDSAFIPGYGVAPLWTTDRGSLQASKLITLQGVRPRITSFAMTSTKTGQPFTVAPAGYFFKADETIEFTLTANVPIFTGTTVPAIEFQLAGNTAWRSATWSKAISAQSMSFSVLIDNTSIPAPQDGRITAVRLNNASSIVDSVGNAFPSTGTGSPATSITLSTDVYIDRTPPNYPTTNLNGTAVGTTPPTADAAVRLYNAQPVLTITGTTGESAPVAKTEYSLNNGVTWRDFPTPVNTTELPWTVAGTAANSLQILPGEWTLITRYTDRAGNIGAERRQKIHVNNTFPKLIAVNIDQSSGWYIAGSNLSFTLDFADAVNVQTVAQVRIVLTNRGSTATTDGSGTNSIRLEAAANQTNIDRAGNTTIKFNWSNISGKEMRNGMYISRIELTGLRDRFTNAGPAADNITYNASTTAPSPIGGNFASPVINNLGIGVKVDAIAPVRSSTTPANGGVSAYPSSATDKRNVITLTFNEPVVKGVGMITIKPQTDFLIPPVFEDNGYYLNQFGGSGDTEVKAAASSNLTTWIPGFYEIYNNAALTAADRNNLTQSTTVASQTSDPRTTTPSSTADTTNPSMSRLVMDARTGQPVGPYIRTTQGLIEGAGITGNYSGAAYNNGPNPEAGRMVPDTATKWVLAYRYGIHNTAATHEPYSTPANAANSNLTNPDTNTTIPNIRNVLKTAKFRWQEIDVILDNVTISGNTVSIRLDEPLLKGLRWELSYPAGTFTDEAGNVAPAQAENNYIFWSAGVQKPVIRVDRRSYDARTANWKTPVTAGQNHTGSYTYAEPPNGSGWGLGSFNTINYRIESETPGATISYGVNARVNSTDGTTTNVASNAVTGAWTGNVANASGTGYTSVAWDTISNTVYNRWVRPNLIHRGGGNGDNNNTYTVNGITRTSTRDLRLLRSYNEDPTPGTLSGLDLTSAGNTNGWYKGTVTFTALEAGKRYVAATAGITNGETAYTSNRGYEGVFRTLILLNATPDGNNGAGKIVVQGSNIKNGMPSIAGFPVQDAAETADSRFVKMMYRQTANSQFIWVSTEIVSEWYFIYFGNGGSHMSAGEVNNYLTVSYGDLTYGYNISHY